MLALDLREAGKRGLIGPEDDRLGARGFDRGRRRPAAGAAAQQDEAPEQCGAREAGHEPEIGTALPLDVLDV
ncbi:MAG TPA: hypothetical protein VIV59_06510, partial [Anaeromyxobacteraceae bacterium]